MICKPDVKWVRRSEPELSDSFGDYWRSLSCTVAWASARVDAADARNCLRLQETRPSFFSNDYFATVREALTTRYDLPENLPVQGDLGGGRLLVYFPDWDLCDGAAEADSSGFLDVNNAPPWDTWVAMFDDPRDEGSPYLIAWVPPQFVPLASAGIYVNPEQCVQWLAPGVVALANRLLNCAV